MWDEKERLMYPEVFGREIADKLGSTIGQSIDNIYHLSKAAGANIAKHELEEMFFDLAEDIYETAPITDGVGRLAKLLKELGYRIGIVSASPMVWINPVVRRLPFENDIELIVSLHERSDLGHKPAPDGYLEAIRFLKASPGTAIVLEDSNSGIKSAKASGAFTIGLRQNLISGYKQQGADASADTIDDVIKLVRQRSTE